MLPYLNSNIVGYRDGSRTICPTCMVDSYGSRLMERIRLGLTHDSSLSGVSAFDLLDGERCDSCSGFFPTIKQANGF